ncbi:SAM-dependent methyltransferase [Streptosporangium carneum]|uniref:S-adenosyl methyltransferase n=1 Tax=Streptosporangium carneum TaxID=47481 RepID=A0A9W6I3W2_9ACTN|nr:SAM-dependent methyltransferase [Streptosporangium carneum]GLK11193.1 hypothetical protein GCM10017600_45990 [Streptosporangium carneum]
MPDASPLLPFDQEPPRGIDSGVAHSARIWNYWLGGKDNYAVDREIGDQFRAIFPDIVDIARSSRGFLARAVRYLAGEAGIRQFLDIGTGLPSVDNTHEVAQRVAPDSRVVYVDNDPLVLAHARALLVSAPGGVTEYIDSDLRDPERILKAARATLDFSQPVALVLMNVLGHVTDTDEARSVVRRLLDALPSGSHLAVADGVNVIRGREFEEAIAVWNREGSTPYLLRAPEEIARFFDGLELVEPGVVSCPHWRPQPVVLGDNREVDEFCAVGRKP